MEFRNQDDLADAFTLDDVLSYHADRAAAVCDGLMLAMTYIRKIDFQKSTEILVNGASGSIGSACVHVANYHGARITAVCNTKDIGLVRSLGAERVIDYTKDDSTQDNQAYDVVIDAVGKSSFFRCKKLLKRGGVHFSTDLGFLAQNAFLATRYVETGQKTGNVVIKIP